MMRTVLITRLGLFKPSLQTRSMSSLTEFLQTIITQEPISVLTTSAATLTACITLYRERQNRANRSLAILIKDSENKLPEDFDSKMKNANLNGKDEAGDTPLHLACIQGNKFIARALLSMGADPSLKNKRGETALYLAAFAGHVSVVDIFLNGSTPFKTSILGSMISSIEILNQPTKANWTPLLAATFNNHYEVATKLITHGARIDIENIKGENPLLFAVMHNNFRLVQHILFNSELSDASVKNLIAHEDKQHNGTPLYIASEKGFIQIVKLLLQRGDQNKACGKYGQTPLHVALLNGHNEVASLLSQNNEAFSHSTPDGWSTIDYIAHRALQRKCLLKSEKEILTQYFLNKNILLNYEFISHHARNQLMKKRGQTLYFHYAILLGTIEHLKEIKKEDTDINIQRSDGSTLLLTAAFFKQTEMALYLIDQGCNINAINQGGESALYYAIRNNDYKLAQKLCIKGINLRHIDNQGYSYMHIVAKYGSPEMAELLLNYGALRDPKTDNFKNLPIHIAVIYGNTAVLKILLKWGADPDGRNVNKLKPLQLARNNPKIISELENAHSQFESPETKLRPMR